MSFSTLMPHLCPEAEIVLACFQPEHSEKNNAHIQSLLRRPLDWQRLLRLAEKHRAIPSVYLRSQSSTPAQSPTDFRQVLRQRFYKNTRRNLFLTQELINLLALFETHKIRAIPYKGTVLAASAYGQLSLRQVCDIDLLVHPDDIPKSRKCLLASGYQLTETYDHEQSFVHNERHVEVDLHWALTPFYFSVNYSFEQLWQDRKAVTINKNTVMSFSDEDLVLILCLQIAKDCWERRQHIENLAKVCDIATLLYNCPNLDWTKISYQANQAGIQRVVLFGLCLAQSLFGAKLPQNIQEQIQNCPPITSLMKQVCKNLFGQFDDDFSEPRSAYSDIGARMRQLLFYFKLREQPIDRITYVLETFKTLPAILLPKAKQLAVYQLNAIVFSPLRSTYRVQSVED